MNTFTHTGFDLFFNNLSNKQARTLVECLNRMKRTMKGQPLRFKLNSKHPRYLAHQASSTVITVRYGEVVANAADLLLGLEANRKIGESFVRMIGIPASYEGSEFYIDGSVEQISADIDQLVKEFEETR